MDSFEPRHLLKFTGDPELQLHYRYLVYNLGVKEVKTERHRCDACNAVLLMQEGPRLKPRQRMTKTIQKLMVKKSKKLPLSRIERFKLNKFMDSSQQMVVKCSQCTFINKKQTISRRDLVKLKSKLISEVEEAKLEKSEEVNKGNFLDAGIDMIEAGSEKIDESVDQSAGKDTITEEKKRKRKKKKNNKNKDFISALIQQKASEKKAKKKKESASTPVSLREFVLSETKDTPSSSSSQLNVDIDIFRKAINSDTSYSQTPVCTESKVETHQQSTAVKSSSKKSKKKSKSDKELRKSLFFETPPSRSDHKKSNNQTPANVTPSVNIQQTLTATPFSKKNKKKVIQKELRKYLSEVPQVQEKSSSLKDFLVSL